MSVKQVQCQSPKVFCFFSFLVRHFTTQKKLLCPLLDAHNQDKSKKDDSRNLLEEQTNFDESGTRTHATFVTRK